MRYRVMGAVIAVGLCLFTRAAVADVYYNEIIEAKSGVTAEQIQANWARHHALWKKKGHAADATGLTARIVGDEPRGKYFFYIVAPSFEALGARFDELLSDPEWAEVIGKWDELRIIRESHMYQDLN